MPVTTRSKKSTRPINNTTRSINSSRPNNRTKEYNAIANQIQNYMNKIRNGNTPAITFDEFRKILSQLEKTGVTFTMYKMNMNKRRK
jgi:hypothetical protein